MGNVIHNGAATANAIASALGGAGTASFVRANVHGRIIVIVGTKSQRMAMYEDPMPARTARDVNAPQTTTLPHSDDHWATRSASSVDRIFTDRGNSAKLSECTTVCTATKHPNATAPESAMSPTGRATKTLGSPNARATIAGAIAAPVMAAIQPRTR